ncbi:MAG: SDR family NAD(P)-dependent oxidoreductase [Deltaproteobacteria bacterium]|nr:SDR family NAD(P)-dependent oxidoreductase [Deltaproteobacteria bacterium]
MRQILITGASSGIGRALALHYARQGETLGLVARRRERLEELAREIEAAGGRALIYPVDVTDGEAMAGAIRDFSRDAGGLSIVIANSGISRSDGLSAGSAAPGAEVFQVNVIGLMNTLTPAIPIMREQGRGHLVAIGSVAGYRGIPGKGAYSSSKAAVMTLMQAWRPVLKRYNINVTYIAPGWVESELTVDNPYPMPFIMPAERAARLIERAITANRARYVFPWQMKIITKILPFVPDSFMPHYGLRKKDKTAGAGQPEQTSSTPPGNK